MQYCCWFSAPRVCGNCKLQWHAAAAPPRKPPTAAPGKLSKGIRHTQPDQIVGTWPTTLWNRRRLLIKSDECLISDGLHKKHLTSLLFFHFYAMQIRWKIMDFRIIKKKSRFNNLHLIKQ